MGNSDTISYSNRIRVPKTSELVADQIRGQIVRGELREGDYLPPEGQLLTTLGISRPTLREAFRILEAEALISVVRGSRTGAKVHKPSVDLVSRYAGYVLQSKGTSIADLYDARLAIEPHVVRRLALARDPEAIARLREEVARLEKMLGEEKFVDFIAGVSEFHRVLIELSGNNTIIFINQLLHQLIAAHQADYIQRHPRPATEHRKSMTIGPRSYIKLIDLIEAGAVEEAIDHWRLHLRNANATWAARGEAERVVDSLRS
ncbi:MAG: FCD domain-containing protein [Candidatus Sphingomonas colombiensis]|nr:FCD domain-containing protein [Sphingomonas sp.]WEK42375.1 MAG: FCD domain-containing protein [Sphingomonas sp.]